MAASSNIATQILHWRTRRQSGMAVIRNYLEKASQTYLQGTPVQLSAGVLQACATINSAATALIAGFSTVPGANLSADGTPKTQNLTQAVPNQPSAVITPIGAPPNDGTSQFLLACDEQTFVITVGHSGTAALAVLAQSMVGSLMGLTKDAGNNFWYADFNITTTAGGACLEVINLIDPVGTLNGRIEVKVTDAAAQLQV